jgi:hypothetical protein
MMPHLRIAEIMSELRKGGRLNADDWALICELQSVWASMGVNCPQTPRTSAAERQKRYRERNALRNGDVTNVTPVPPKEKNQTPLPPETLRVSTPKRGHRLPSDYRPPDSLWEKAKKFGLSDETLKFETSAFKDHFLSVAGAKALKIDWDRAWLNWMRESLRRKKPWEKKSTNHVVSGPWKPFTPEKDPPKPPPEERERQVISRLKQLRPTNI